MEKDHLIIRLETPEDYVQAETLAREAFWNLYVPGCSEHLVLHKLRMNADFIPELAFVALIDGQIVGQIAYSRARIEFELDEALEVLSFGPVSVLPEQQKQGIGGSLIRHTIDLAKDMGYPAILIYGDPCYYSRFGFRCAEKYDIKTSFDKFAVALLALELKAGILGRQPGKFVESEAFAVDESELAQFEKHFPAKEKFETESQKEFRILSSLFY